MPDGRRSARRWPLLLAAIVLALGGLAAPRSAAAEQAINFDISPLRGSGVSGLDFLTTNDQGTNARVILAGLRGRASAVANLNGGTCDQPSASVLRLASLKVDERGRAEGTGAAMVGGRRDLTNTSRGTYNGGDQHHLNRLSFRIVGSR